MKTCAVCSRFAVLALGFLAIAGPGSAQTTPSAPAPAPAAVKDDAIRLSEFDVSSTQTRGYQAANSISATGIGVPSYNVPLPIMVITSEFIKDTGALDMRDAIQYTPGVVTDPRNEAAFTLRGFSGNIVYRNGFYRRQNYQTWDMARVEVIEGPAAIFFGSVRPGGIINYVTAKPDFTQTYTDVSVQAGSFNTYKGTLVYNQAVNKNLALRFSLGGLDSDNNGYRYDFLREEHYSAVATLRMGDRQQLTVEADRERRNDYLDERGYALTHEGYLGNAAAIASGQSVTAWVAANYGATAPVFTTFAPIYPANDPYGRKYAYNTDNFEKFYDWDVDLDYLFKINEHIVFESALSRGQDDQPGLRANNGDQTPFANGKVTMNFQYFENDRNSLVSNNRVTFKFDTAGVKNTLQLGQQFQEVRTDQPGFTNAAGSFSSNNLSANITNFDPINSPPLTNTLGLVFANQPINNWRHAVDITRGYYAALQSAFFNDRVHLLAGARYAVINGSVGYSTRPTNPSNVGTSTATTPQLGIIGEVIPGLSLYATYSRSIEPQNGSVDVTGVVAGPIKSKGLDAGVKTSFMDGRLAATLDYFTLNRAGIASTDTARQVATGLSPFFIFNTTNEARGVTLDANLAATDNNNLIVGIQHMLKSNITAAPAANANMIGQPLADVPTNMISLWDRYTIKEGLLKGFSVAFGGRYSSSAAISSSPTTTVRNPSFVVLNGMISRSFLVWKHRVRAQFNVNNLADKVYRDGPEGMFASPRKYFLTLETRF